MSKKTALSAHTPPSSVRRRPIGVRLALGAMDEIGQLDVSRVMGRLALTQAGKILGALVAVGIAIGGWIVLVILAGSSAMTIVSVVVVPVVTGGLAASVGRHPKFCWPLLGFVVPPILILASVPRPPPNGEGSGYTLVVLTYSLLALPTLCLGFYGWLRIRRSTRRADTSTRDVAEAD
jgi:hypothetical protein